MSEHFCLVRAWTGLFRTCDSRWSSRETAPSHTHSHTLSSPTGTGFAPSRCHCLNHTENTTAVTVTRSSIPLNIKGGEALNELYKYTYASLLRCWWLHRQPSVPRQRADGPKSESKKAWWGDCRVSDPDSLNSDPDLDMDPGGSKFTHFGSRYGSISRHFAELSNAWTHIET